VELSLLVSYLFPKEASDAESTASVTAPTEQPDEHGEKQDDVRGDHDDDVEFGALGVEHYTFSQSGFPSGAELQMDKPRRSKVLRTVFTRTIPDAISHLYVISKVP